MKPANIFSGFFAVLGLVLMVGTILLCLLSLNAEPRLVETPEEAQTLSEELMEALCAGDYEAASAMIYGQPELGGTQESDDPVSIALWSAFQDSLSYEFNGPCYATDEGIARDVTVTALNISSVTDTLAQRTETLVAEQMQKEADAMPKDENRPTAYQKEPEPDVEDVEQALAQAVEQALAEDAVMNTWNATLNLICQDGQWWAVPDQALLQAISGAA